VVTPFLCFYVCFVDVLYDIIIHSLITKIMKKKVYSKPMMYDVTFIDRAELLASSNEATLDVTYVEEDWE